MTTHVTVGAGSPLVAQAQVDLAHLRISAPGVLQTHIGALRANKRHMGQEDTGALQQVLQGIHDRVAVVAGAKVQRDQTDDGFFVPAYK